MWQSEVHTRIGGILQPSLQSIAGAPSQVSWRDLPHVFLILGPRLVMALIIAMITAAGKTEHDELHMASQSLH